MPEYEDPRIELEDRGKYLALVPTCRNILFDEGHPFYDQMAEHPLRENRGRPHCMDFGGADHLIATMLPHLIELHNRLRGTANESGRRLPLAEKLGIIVPPQCYEMFVMTRLHKLFYTHLNRKDYEKALDSV